MSEKIKTMGIVLKSSKHTTDAARLIEIFSPELGRFSAVIRGVEKPKAKLAVASQPFCFGEFILNERNGYYTVLDCSVQDSFFSVAYNLDSYVLCSSMLEITSKITQAGESNFEVFKLLLSCLKMVVYENASPSVVAIKFMIEMLNISGFGFNIESCEVCGKNLFDQGQVGIVYAGSGAVCFAHKDRLDSVLLTPSEWETLKNINICDINSINELETFPREALDGCISLLARQIFYRTGEKVRSLEKYL